MDDLPVVVEPNSQQLEIWRYENQALVSDLLKTGEATWSDWMHWFGEWKKFALICTWYGPGIPMTSRTVDRVWHAFLLRTVDYRRFCEQFLGRFLDHVPRGPNAPPNPGGRLLFEALYARQFGPLHEVWKGDLAAGKVPIVAANPLRPSPPRESVPGPVVTSNIQPSSDGYDCSDDEDYTDSTDDVVDEICGDSSDND